MQLPPSIRTSASFGSLEQQAALARPSMTPTRSSQSNSVQPPSSVRTALPVNSLEQNPLSKHRTSNSIEQLPSARSVGAGNPSQPINSVEQTQPSSAKSNYATRISQSNVVEQPVSARSASRSSLGGKAVPMVPPSVPLTLRSSTSAPQAELQAEVRKEKRLLLSFCTIVMVLFQRAYLFLNYLIFSK